MSEMRYDVLTDDHIIFNPGRAGKPRNMDEIGLEELLKHLSLCRYITRDRELKKLEEAVKQQLESLESTTGHGQAETRNRIKHEIIYKIQNRKIDCHEIKAKMDKNKVREPDKKLSKIREEMVQNLVFMSLNKKQK